jgi:hypothetical protein
MFSAPAVMIHGLDHARAALAPGLPVVLLSAPGAALYGGCGWWRGLLAAARADGGTAFGDLLDCADAPGAAMAALRAGLRGLVLDGACPGYAAVASAASRCGAIVLPRAPASLDLAAAGAARCLLPWLQRDINPAVG